MKTKVFALILAILCLSMAVVGCNQECAEHVDENKDAKCDKCEAAIVCATHTDENKDLVCDVCGGASVSACEKHVDADKNLECDTCKTKLCDHKDENADNLCDSCGVAVVAVNVQVPPTEEERVDMVVSTIPTDVALDQYVNVVPEADKSLKGEAVTYDSLVGRFALTSETDPMSHTTDYTVKDLVTGNIVYSENNVKEDQAFFIDLGAYYFTVTSLEADGSENPATIYEYYSYDGKRFYDESVAYGEEKTAVVGEVVEIECRDEDDWTYYYVDVYYKLTIDQKIYIFDLETGELLFAELDAKNYVERPVFDVVTDDYGYKMYGGCLYVYDLSEWINCVYSYEIPSYAQDMEWYVLENGNVALQWYVTLNNSAASYDYLDWNGIKCDLVTMLFNVADKKIAEVDFGYVISRTYDVENYDIIKDTTPNVFRVYPIVNDRVDVQGKMYLAIDNDLKVLYNFAQTLTTFEAPGEIIAVDTNLFMTFRDFDDIWAYEILNEKGEHVCYLPEGAVPLKGFVVYRNAYYNYKMELVLDPAELGYDPVLVREDFVVFAKLNIYTEKNEYFYFNGKGEPTKIKADVVSVVSHDLGFVVKHVVENADEESVFFYSLYNADNTLIVTAESDFEDYVRWIDYEGRVGIVETIDGTTYVVK